MRRVGARHATACAGYTSEYDAVAGRYPLLPGPEAGTLFDPWRPPAPAAGERPWRELVHGHPSLERILG